MQLQVLPELPELSKLQDLQKTKLAQGKVEFWFEFCNFAVRFSLYCLASLFEF